MLHYRILYHWYNIRFKAYIKGRVKTLPFIIYSAYARVYAKKYRKDLDVLKVKKDSHVYTITVHTIKSNNTDINSIKVDDYVYEINSSEAHYFDCKDINSFHIISFHSVYR